MRMPMLELARAARGQILFSSAIGMLVTACHVLQGIFLSLALAAVSGLGRLPGAPPRASWRRSRCS